MSVKCLCKIGILQSSNKKDKTSKTIKHNGKLYEPLVDCDFNQLTEDINRHRDFCLVGLKCDDTEYCTIFHDGTRQPGRNLESRARILSLVFPEFKSSCCLPDEDDETEDDKVAMMNYVTTKLYDLLRAAHMSHNTENIDDVSVDHDRLQPTLREYQRKTIRWLLRREKESIELQHFYKKLKSTEGCECYVNLLKYDIQDESGENIPIPKGGILADEMGLGKTVEVLALVLLNVRNLSPASSSSTSVQHPPVKRFRKDSQIFCVCQSKKTKKLVMCSKCLLYQHEKCVDSYVETSCSDGVDYVCPKCWEALDIIIPSAATVIVSPHPIKLQWLSEMNKHVNPPMKVLVYEGISKKKWSPKELAAYDIVLTDYNTLRREIHFTASNETNISFRHQRQIMRVNSPLMLVEWWRVCLDEAQMESSNSNATKTVRKLPAIHRWAVTGTPIQRSLDDLTTVLEFVGLTEVCSNQVWQQLTMEFIRGRSEKLINILQKVMWRTCKSSVLEELGIPPQSEVVHFVELNNVEWLFYSDEHEDCAAAFYEKIEGYSDLTGISPKILKNILQPMLKLRQDCTIPVLCIKSAKAEQNIVKKFLQPQELLDHLKSNNEIECKSQLRTMASSYNGIAAIHFLQEQHANAIKYYQLVMKLAKEYTGTISIDSLLQIHALHNMIQAFRIIESEDSKALEEYEAQCHKLEWKYLEPYSSNLQSAYKAYISAWRTLNETEEKMPTTSAKFWAQVLNAIDKGDLADQLIHKINEDVFSTHSNTLYERFRSTHGMLLVINLWYEKIDKIRIELTRKFREFDFFIESVRPRNDVPVGRWRMMKAFIRSVYDCHLSDLRNETNQEKPEMDDTAKKKVCQLCAVERSLQNYECLIFNKVLDEKSSNAEGTWNPTMQENILKAIYTAVKAKKELTMFVKNCEIQLEAINLMKTEYKELVKLWIEIEYTVKAYDEMDMCKMRISLAESEEKKTKYQISSYEMDTILSELQMNYHHAQKEFTLKYSRLKYLRHLQKDTDPGACPICGVEEQNKYVVLECGHHMCLMCLKTMSKVQKTTTLNCSICRNEQKYQNVYYVNRRLTEECIKGDYSSKIEKIVLEVLKLKSIDEKVKILIFSTWQPILKAISEALEDNSITFKLRWSPQSLQQFKDETLGITCMLMMLHHGSQGLNLVEATHVFLVEPILNPGEELQAIGRVHRIGQTKPTTVHRFIVKYTIEENIYNATTKDKTKKWSNLTLESIKKLFELLPKNS